MTSKTLNWAKELQALAQAGMHYSKDVYDIERFERIREISAEMIGEISDLPIEKIRNLFCNEIGYQTPKLDSRAAIIKDNKILMVRETYDGKWSLPGGWVDHNLSIGENVIKEAKEEAGAEVTADRLIAVLDKAKHNKLTTAYGICKIFILCSPISENFVPNSEVSESRYFSLNELPELSSGRVNEEQIKMCFDAYNNPDWKVIFD